MAESPGSRPLKESHDVPCQCNLGPRPSERKTSECLHNNFFNSLSCSGVPPTLAPSRINLCSPFVFSGCRWSPAHAGSDALKPYLTQVITLTQVSGSPRQHTKLSSWMNPNILLQKRWQPALGTNVCEFL